MKKKPVYQPPETPVKKKKRRVWLYVLGVILALGVIGNLVNPNSNSTIPTASPTPPSLASSTFLDEILATPDPTPEPTPTPSPTPDPTPTPKPTPAEPTEKPVVYVWLPESGSKYHSNSSCSGMDNPQKVTLEEAQAMGYTACKRCYRF